MDRRVTEKLTAPPPGPIAWLAYRSSARGEMQTSDSCMVRAQTWFRARALAAEVLGEHPEDIELFPDPRK